MSAAGRRRAIVGAALALLAALATLVFAAAWALGGSARLAHRGAGPLPARHAFELTDRAAPRVVSVWLPDLSVRVTSGVLQFADGSSASPSVVGINGAGPSPLAG